MMNSPSSVRVNVEIDHMRFAMQQAIGLHMQGIQTYITEEISKQLEPSLLKEKFSKEIKQEIDSAVHRMLFGNLLESKKVKDKMEAAIIQVIRDELDELDSAVGGD